MKTKKPAAIICAVLVIVSVCTCLLSWFAPITIFTPIFLMNSRPELADISENLYIGQGIGMHISNPLIAHLGSPAWHPQDFVYGVTRLSDKARAGEEVYYPLFTDEEIAEDKQREQVSLYRLSADNEEKRPYVLLLAGGGFISVCTPMESLPVAAAFNDLGYTAFCLTYRISESFGGKPETIAEDIYKAVSFITEHAEEFNIDPSNYLIGGFSAGGMAISEWCNPETGYQKYGAQKPGAACFIYGVNESYKNTIDVPAFIRYCIDDVHFEVEGFDNFESGISDRNIPTDYKKVDCPHGFGLGTGTEAEGWVNEAETFWKEQIK